MGSSLAFSNDSRLRLVERLKAELALRAKRKTDRLTQFRDNPAGFIEHVLLGFVWSKQREICEALTKHRRVAVRSCHDVGKSYIAASLGTYWNSVYDPGEAFLVTLAPTGHQVKAILWREMNRMHARGQLPGYMTQTEWKLDSGELIGMGRSPKDTDPTAIQGIHQRRVLVIFDEACGVATPLWDAADSLIANEESRFLAIGNPDDPSTEFATICKPGSGWHVIGISAFESPNFTGEVVPDYLRPLLVSRLWQEEKIKKWGKSSPIYTSKVLGEFPTESKDGLIPLKAITAALVRDVPREDFPNDLGCDIARFGDDHTVIYHRRGIHAKKIAKFNGRDLMQVCGAIVQAAVITGATRIKVDDTGMGGGVTDRLKEIKCESGSPIANVQIVPVNVGEGPTTKLPPKRKQKPQSWHKPPTADRYKTTERFINLRAQLNWGMRERFEDGDIVIEPTFEDLPDEDLQAQAGDIKYELTSRGQIKIESKDDMKARGRPSPDDWDGLVLAFADIEPGLDIWSRLAQ